MNKLKVVHICNYFYPKIGGEEKYIHQIAKKQVELGLDVSVITRNHEGNINSVEIIDGIKVYRVKGSNIKFLRLLTSMFHMKAILKAIDANIYHAHDWSNSLVCKLAKKKFITTIHGYSNLDNKFLIKDFIRYILGKSERIAVNHKFLLKQYSEYHPTYIHAGIDLKEYPYNEVKRNNTFLVVSNLYGPRRVGVYIEGFKLLEKGYKMLIAGDGIERKELEELSKGYNIEFLGYREDVKELISNAMVVCGGPLTAIESMVLGRPCIIVNGKDTEVVTGANTIDNKEDFVHEANYIIKNLEILSKKYHEFAKEEYSIDKVVKKYQRLYNGII